MTRVQRKCCGETVNLTKARKTGYPFFFKTRPKPQRWIYILYYIQKLIWWIIELSVKSKTIIFLEGGIRQNLYDLGLGKYFLNMSPKAQFTDANLINRT